MHEILLLFFSYFFNKVWNFSFENIWMNAMRLNVFLKEMHKCNESAWNFIWEFLCRCINECMIKIHIGNVYFFIFVYWMHDAYMKSIFYWNNNMKLNSILFVSLFVLNKTLKMHECMRLWRCKDECIDSIWNCFFYKMHVCYLHWVHEWCMKL